MELTKLSWDTYIALVLTLKKHQKYKLMKAAAPPLPNNAQPRVARSFRIKHYNIGLKDGKAIHIEDYSDHYLLHWDEADPIKHPIKHIIKDASRVEQAAALGLVGVAVDWFILNGKYTRKFLGIS